MFKMNNPEDDLFENMSKQLKANALESKKGFNKLAKVTDLLNTAAEIFDKVGMTKEADSITNVLNDVVAKLKAGK